MAASSLHMSKQTLENTTMQVYRVRESKTIATTKIEVELELQKMKTKTAYAREVGPDKWNLEVVRGRQDVTLTLFTKAPLPGTAQDVKCRVQYDEAETSKWVVAQKESWDKHVITLPQAIVSHPGNTFLISGRGLVCVLRVVTSIGASDITPCGEARPFEEGQLPSLMFDDARNKIIELNDSDEEYLLDCLVNNLACSLFTDFNLRCLEKSVVRAHKSVLAARSGYFRDFLRENAETRAASVDYMESLIQVMIYFLYYAQVHDPSARLIEQLLDLAERFAIESLEGFCMNYVRRYLTLKKDQSVVGKRGTGRTR